MVSAEYLDECEYFRNCLYEDVSLDRRKLTKFTFNYSLFEVIFKIFAYFRLDSRRIPDFSESMMLGI